MRSIIKKGIFAGVVGIALLFISSRFFFFREGPLEQASAHLMYPLIQIAHTVTSPIQRFFQNRQRYSTLMENYNRLQRDYNTLLSQSVKQRAQSHFAQKTSELIEFAQRYELSQALLAKVLLRNISDNHHFFLVNRGTRDGVKKDMIATYNDHIIGRVSTAYYWYSKIRLITDQHCKVAAYASTTNATGIVQGLNSLHKTELTYVSHLLDVADNDLIISSGQGLVFPEGFCLGKIVHHKKKEKALYHTIYLEPQVDLEKISHCLIVDQSKIHFF